VSICRCIGYQIDLTLLPELAVVSEDVQCKRVVPGIDEFDSLIEIVDGDDGQNWRKYFTGRGAAFRTINSVITNHVHSLAHQGIVGTDIPDDRRSDIFCLTVCFSANDDSSFSVVQQFLDPVKASVAWHTSDVPGLSRAVRIKFLISGRKHPRSTS